VATQPQRRRQTARRAFGKQDGIGRLVGVGAACNAADDAHAARLRDEFAHGGSRFKRRAGRDGRSDEPVVEIAALDDGAPRRLGRPAAGDRDTAGRAHRPGGQREPVGQIDAEFGRNPNRVR
jgi:hypothetical protein